MNKYVYFKVPTQVKFWDVVCGRYIGGIAYRDEIICGCCGSVFKISEIYKLALDDELAPDALKENPIIIVKSWKSINYKIFKKS